MSSRRGAVALSFIAVPKRASARAITKASSSAVRPSPSRPHPKCFIRAADIFRSPYAPPTVRSGPVLASLGLVVLPLRLEGGDSVVRQFQQASGANRIGSQLAQFLNQSEVTMH